MRYAGERQQTYKLLIEKSEGIEYFSGTGVNDRKILN
jgi:hypothetical protein